MKRIYYSIIVLLFGLNAFAQTSDTTHRDAAKSSVPESMKNALYVVDGKIYDGNINNLNMDDIASITVSKSAEMTKKYGTGSVNGVIMIQTKSGSANPVPSPVVQAQVTDSARYVIDGVVSDKKGLSGISPEDIESIRVVKDNNTGPSKSGIVFVTTKIGAAAQYKLKFSSFSETYKKYLNAYDNDDSALSYTIDGYRCDKSNDGLTRLSNLDQDKIAKVKFSEKAGSVDVTTKK